MRKTRFHESNNGDPVISLLSCVSTIYNVDRPAPGDPGHTALGLAMNIFIGLKKQCDEHCPMAMLALRQQSKPQCS